MVTARVWRNPWWEQASCQGINTELFFIEQVGNRHVPLSMARMCFNCPVKVTCRLQGYTEYYGLYGNAQQTVRDRLRHRIFYRLYGVELDADDNLNWFRRKMFALIEDNVDIVDGMRKAGFNEEEIDLFLADTTLDERAREYEEANAHGSTDQEG